MELVEELKGVGIGVFKHIPYHIKPVLHLLLRVLVSVIFVVPVCRNTFFGYRIHPFASDLYLYPSSSVAHHSAVESFIAVALGSCYPIP